jgi:hypothetical protein
MRELPGRRVKERKASAREPGGHRRTAGGEAFGELPNVAGGVAEPDVQPVGYSMTMLTLTLGAAIFRLQRVRTRGATVSLRTKSRASPKSLPQLLVQLARLFGQGLGVFAQGVELAAGLAHLGAGFRMWVTTSVIPHL